MDTASKYDAVMISIHPDEIPPAKEKIFDSSSSCWSDRNEYNQVFLRSQQNYANDLLRARGHVFLNEICDMLGLPRTRLGVVLGWTSPGYIDFVADFSNNKSIALTFNVDGVIYDLI